MRPLDVRRAALLATILAIVAVWATPAPAAEPPAPIPDPQPPLKIATPAGPIAAGTAVQLPVEGLRPTDLPIAKASVWPRETATLVPARPWGAGDPFIWFQARAEGSYLVWVACPRDGGLAYTEGILVVGKPTPPPPPPPVNPYRPAPQYQALVGPVTQLRLSRPDADHLSSLFSGLSKNVLAGSAPTTGALRAALVETLAPAKLRDKYPGLGTALENVLAEALGLENVPLDKGEAAALLETVAWAVWQTGGG